MLMPISEKKREREKERLDSAKGEENKKRRSLLFLTCWAKRERERELEEAVIARQFSPPPTFLQVFEECQPLFSFPSFFLFLSFFLPLSPYIARVGSFSPHEIFKRLLILTRSKLCCFCCCKHTKDVRRHTVEERGRKLPICTYEV